MKLPRSIRRLALVAGLFFLSACATYQNKVSFARTLIEAGKADEAAQKLEPLAEKQDGDQLVYLLDYGTALQLAGKYKDSNRVYLSADKLMEEVDYHSASRIAGSLLLNEEMVQYKGDTFEKIFVNAQLALNYLELGELDDALVEARRINEKFQKYRQDEKQKFEMNPFAKYLSAMIWEADGKLDDAAIAYQEAYSISESIGSIGEDLIRSAKRARRMDQYKEWKAKFPEVQERDQWYDRSLGELVVIVQQGWGPRKDFGPDVRFPILRPIGSYTRSAQVTVQGVGTFFSRDVYDVQSAAIQTLNDDMGALVAKRLAGIVAKEAAARELQRKNELVGAVAWIAMHASDRADLRQWSTLPQTIQVIRVPLKPGTYDIDLQGLSGGGMPTEDRSPSRKITIKQGRKVFVNWRTVH